MSYFKRMLTLVAAGVVSVAAANEPAVMDELLQHTRNLLKSQQEVLGAEFAEVLRAKPVTEEAMEWLEPSVGLEWSAGGTVEDGTAQGRAWNEIETEMMAAAEPRDSGPDHPPVPEDVLYVYISLSMPALTIRSLFLEALDSKDTLDTVFVLRGWDVPGPNQLVSRLNALFPDAEHLGELPNVQINPVLYQQQHVELVPTYSKKDTGGRWGQVVGVTTLADAVRRIEEARYDGEVIGPAYRIEEPDILKLIEERAAAIDWEAEVSRVRDGLLTKRTTGGALPYALENESYLVDLTIVNNQDLSGTSGEVFAFAGDSINPLDYLTLSRKYVFIDANSAAQVQQAVRWRQEHAPVTVITTLPVATVEERKRVMGTLGQQVFEINDLLVRRFQLRAVPSLAYQEGRMLRIDVVATDPQVLTTEAASERR